MRGSFGHATVLGVTDPRWPPGSYATPLLGNPVAGQHLWAGLSAGGRRVLPIRHFANENAVRFLAYAGADDLAFVPEAVGYAGLCHVDDGGLHQPSADPRFAYAVDDAGTGRWVERGVLDLRLRLDPALPAIQLATPDATEPLVYLARVFRVESGTALGATVDDGYAFHEQVYLPSGRGWAISSYKTELQGTWIAFVTRYDDGAVDWGQLCWGDRGWSFALVVRSTGEHALVHRPPGSGAVDAAGRFVALDLDLGPHGVWTWRAGGRVPLPGPPDTTPQWSEGTVVRADERRGVAFAHTWAETYPARLRRQ